MGDNDAMLPVRRRLVLLALLAAALPAACARAPEPRPVPGPPPEVPVVFVPGVTGSVLRDRGTGEVAWGAARNLFFPRDGGYALAYPLAPPDGWEPRLEPGGVLEEIRLGPARQPVYGPLLEALTARGYRRGDHEAGRPGDTLFGFAYDWRRSNVESAGELVARLDALRRARGGERLTVDLLCQSSGTHVCRYLVRHGGARLDEAEAGPGAAPPPWLEVRNLVLVAGSSGGALRSLRELDRGRRYVALVGRRMRPEVLFTFRSLFEDLPQDPEGRLLDARGLPLEADLYDPETWIRHGWSVFAPEAERRLATAGREELFGIPEERRAFLESALADARRFHRLLAADPLAASTPCYHLIGNAYLPTAQRAVVERTAGGWRTGFTGDPAIERHPYLRALASAPGDGHATLASQLHLTHGERARVVGQPFLVQGGHFELILDPATHRRIHEALQTPGC
jgi:hypothetical protein